MTECACQTGAPSVRVMFADTIGLYYLFLIDPQVRYCLPDILLATMSILYTKYKQLRYINVSVSRDHCHSVGSLLYSGY